MKRTDAEIQQAVLRELACDTRLTGSDVGVQVDGGVVSLTGTVSSWARRHAAQEAAHRVSGVFDVANELQVNPAGAASRSDTDIARAVRDTLEWDVFVPDKQIRSTVSHGRVTLEGSVTYHRERDDVERAVRDLSGVVAVINRIDVVPPPITEAALRKSIQAALERQIDRENKHIQIEVQDGRVALAGVVHSLHEREAVLGAIKGTPGVRCIDNRLRVDPYAS